jgi:hypothetical protein
MRPTEAPDAHATRGVPPCPFSTRNAWSVTRRGRRSSGAGLDIETIHSEGATSSGGVPQLVLGRSRAAQPGASVS